MRGREGPRRDHWTTQSCEDQHDRNEHATDILLELGFRHAHLGESRRALLGRHDGDRDRGRRHCRRLLRRRRRRSESNAGRRPIGERVALSAVGAIGRQRRAVLRRGRGARIGPIPARVGDLLSDANRVAPLEFGGSGRLGRRALAGRVRQGHVGRRGGARVRKATVAGRAFGLDSRLRPPPGQPLIDLVLVLSTRHGRRRRAFECVESAACVLIALRERLRGQQCRGQSDRPCGTSAWPCRRSSPCRCPSPARGQPVRRTERTHEIVRNREGTGWQVLARGLLGKGERQRLVGVKVAFSAAEEPVESARRQ